MIVSKPCAVIGAGSRESELIDALRLILDKLNSGNIPITEEMVKRAQAGGLISRGAGGTQTTFTVHGGEYIIIVISQRAIAWPMIY